MHKLCTSIALVAGVCLSQSAFADQSHLFYSLAAGAKSNLIAIPISNSPVVFSCVQNTAGDVGEGQATLVRSTTDGLLDWTAYDYFSNTVSHGFSSVAGTHIVYCDFTGQLDIEVGSAIQIQVVNKSNETLTGELMFTY